MPHSIQSERGINSNARPLQRTGPLFPDVHKHRFRRNPVRYHLELAESDFLVSRNTEPNRIKVIGRHRHAPGVMRPTVANVAGFDVRDANQRKVRRGLRVISLSGAWRESVKPKAKVWYVLPALMRSGAQTTLGSHSRRGPPVGRVDFNVV